MNIQRKLLSSVLVLAMLLTAGLSTVGLRKKPLASTCFITAP